MANHHVLIRKGKRNAASYLQAECLQSENTPQLFELLSFLLDPDKPIDDWETIEWLRWLMAGGRTPDDFSTTVRRYDNASCCGLVWTANFVAYRCRTCGISPCMSLCAECFQRGNHDGHDFNMFRSQAGGACDCGDDSVMRATGFCDQHQQKSRQSVPNAPRDLLCVAKAMISRLVLRLIQHLRSRSNPGRLKSLIRGMQEADNYVTFLNQLSEMGEAMRKIITATLCNPQVYQDLIDNDESEFSSDAKASYEAAKKSLQNPDSPSRFQFNLDILGLKQDLEHHTFLEELLFWTIKYEFPQKLVCFLLNMLPDAAYKESFTTAFVLHYGRIAMLLSRSRDAETLANHVVHVSVQLFSNEGLSFRMTEKHHLLYIIIFSLKSIMESILIQNTITDPSINFHHVVDCASHLMKHHCYWPLVSDLGNILSHQAISLHFMQDDELIKMWFEILTMLQGMNVNKRELEEHVEFEPNTYYAAFSAEIELSASPMWSILGHLKDSSTLHLTKRMMHHCVQELRSWLDAMADTASAIDNDHRMSFHLTLHRYLSVLLCNAVKNQGAKLDELMEVDMWKELMIHPLRAQVTFHEIMNGLWIRNGIQMKGQAMTYIQCKFCTSMVDPDVYLIQLSAMNIEPDLFITTVLSKFHVLDWFTVESKHENPFFDSEHELQMLQGCLTFLASIISIRTNTGMTAEEVLSQEMVTLLCMSDRTHSQLMDLLPEKCGTSDLQPNRNFESTLQKVADYVDPNLKSGGSMSQGMYVPKGDVWKNKYDPLYAFLRAVHRRDYQATLDRYINYMKQSGNCKKTESLWPPYRLPTPVHPVYNKDLSTVLNCKTIHAIIFITLYKILNHSNTPEQILPIIVYFVEVLVVLTEKNSTGDQSQIEPVPRTGLVVQDKDFSEWFCSANILHVIQETVERIQMNAENHSDDKCAAGSSRRSSDNMEFVDIDDMDDDDDDLDQHAVESSHEHMALGYMNLPPLSLEDQPNALVPRADGSIAISSPSSDVTPDITYPPDLDSLSLFLPLPPSLSPSITPPPANPPLALTSFDSMAVVPNYASNASSCSYNTGISERSSEDAKHFKALTYLSKNSIKVNESILSMLVKLHCKLSDGKVNSYVPLSRRSGTSSDVDADCNFGDGPFYIQQLLDRICKLTGCAALERICNTIWPSLSNEQKRTDDVRANDSPFASLDKDERKRRAKERQQKLMAEFTLKQKAFMQKTMETDHIDYDEGASAGARCSGAGPSSASSSSPSHQDTMEEHQKEYDCVICGQTTPSTTDRPFGLVTFLQASSVLGHSYPSDSKVEYSIPCSEEGKDILLHRTNRAVHIKERIEILCRNFSESSWQTALNLGWEGGVYGRSCGHYLHLDCHKSYMQSLKREQSQRSQSNKLAFERGEYSCPLCRQRSNTVLPWCPDVGEAVAVVKCRGHDLAEVTNEIAELLAGSSSPKVSDVLRCMVFVIEDLTNATYPEFRSVGSSPNPHSLFMFVCSIARTNLELELVHRGGNLISKQNKRSCFSTLFKVLALNTKILHTNSYAPLWSQLSGIPLDDPYSVSLVDQEVPLLLQDPIAILIQIILTLPTSVDKAFYNCIIHTLYNLTCVQALALVSCHVMQCERQRWKNHARRDSAVLGIVHNYSLLTLLGIIIDHLEHSSLYLCDEDMLPQFKNVMTAEEIKEFTRNQCLPFIRIASLLQYHLYDDQLPESMTSDEEFSNLCSYLGLTRHPESTSLAASVSAADFIMWATSHPSTLLYTWCQDYIVFINRSQISARSLLEKPAGWRQPCLLQLPREYSTIFQFYHKKVCTKCYSVPKDPSVCLLCGAMVCLRENCCRQQNMLEAVRHSIACGAGTAMFLVVNSSTVIVIRDKRACIWGSVYLDSYGEEDRDLKRGKPLYLCKERYALLEHQWLTHIFDNTNKQWIWHKDNL
ncbi:UBR3 (predicted) [Pycnogonum litorale]